MGDSLPERGTRNQEQRTKNDFFMTDLIIHQPIDGIRMWNNARTYFDQKELEELAASLLETKGAQQYPVGFLTDGTGSEVALLMGERRWRAYRILRDKGHADYAALPVRIVAQPSEKDAYKWSLIENLQRVNLRPSETAEWVARMLDLEDEETGRKVWTMESLGEDLGKDKGYIDELMQMRRAPLTVREAVDAGACAVRIGRMIGSLPQEMREGAAAEIVFGPMGCMTVAAAQDWISTHYRRDLRRADFATDQVGLDGKPACVRCEWWGGNRADVGGKNAVHSCLNPACFAAKQRAAVAASVEEEQVIEPEAAEGMWEVHTGRLAPSSGYVDLEEKPSPLMLADGGRGGAVVPSWGEILEGSGVAPMVTWDPRGARRSLVETGEALRAAGQSKWGALFRDGVVNEYLSPEERAAERKARAAGDAEHRAAVSEGLCELARGLRVGTQELDEVIAAAARVALEDLCKGEDLALVAEVLGVKMGEGRTLEHLENAVGAMRGAELGAAMVTVLLARRVRYEGFAPLIQEDGAPLAELCRMAGFDAGAWHRQARRRRNAAERAGRDKAMEDAKGKAQRAIGNRATKRE